MERRSSLSAIVVLVAREERAVELRSEDPGAHGPYRTFLRRAARGSPPAEGVPIGAGGRPAESKPPARSRSSGAAFAHAPHGPVLGAPALDPFPGRQRLER